MDFFAYLVARAFHIYDCTQFINLTPVLSFVSSLGTVVSIRVIRACIVPLAAPLLPDMYLMNLSSLLLYRIQEHLHNIHHLHLQIFFPLRINSLKPLGMFSFGRNLNELVTPAIEAAAPIGPSDLDSPLATSSPETVDHHRFHLLAIDHHDTTSAQQQQLSDELH